MVGRVQIVHKVICTKSRIWVVRLEAEIHVARWLTYAPGSEDEKHAVQPFLSLFSANDCHTDTDFVPIIKLTVLVNSPNKDKRNTKHLKLTHLTEISEFLITSTQPTDNTSETRCVPSNSEGNVPLR